MESSQLLGITTFVYLAATFFYVAFAFFKVKGLGTLGTSATLIGLVVNTAGIGLRWMETYQQGIGHIPLSNMYESLVFFALSIAAVYLVIEHLYKAKILGSFVLPFAFIAMAYASYSAEFGKDVKPLLPALQSNWLTAHVVTCFIGYAAFAISCGLAIYYLSRIKFSNNQNSPKNESTDTGTVSLLKIDDIIYKMMAFGFIWLTVGIITGAIWANSAWGTYWSWDPKETWSLITWFVYALALHARYTRGWNGTRMSIVALVGFISVIFTYYGVNFLLSGLHSYGG